MIIFDHGYNLRGFSVENAGPAKTAIDTYIDSLNTEIDKMESAKQNVMDSALKGTSQQDKVSSYIDMTKKELKTVVEFFQAFKEGINQAEKNYDAAQQSINVNEVEDARSAANYTDSETVTGVKPFSE